MLCLTRAEWGLASSARVRDVWVGWPRLMAGALRTPGVMDPPTVQEVAGTIDARLPPDRRPAGDPSRPAVGRTGAFTESLARPTRSRNMGWVRSRWADSKGSSP